MRVGEALNAAGTGGMVRVGDVGEVVATAGPSSR